MSWHSQVRQQARLWAISISTVPTPSCLYLVNCNNDSQLRSSFLQSVATQFSGGVMQGLMK